MLSQIGTIRDYVYNIINSSGQQLYESKIISIGNALNALSECLNANGIKFETNKICVVGLQSSGKSTVLNNIMNMPFLPTSQGISTRLPIHIEMYNTSESKAIFGSYLNGQWQDYKTIHLSLPEPSPTELKQIETEIQLITDTKAGTGTNVTNSPIYVRIYSPNVPNFTLIDTPGIISFGDKKSGQNSNTNKYIRDIIADYIKDPKTIILSIVTARPDINADFGLGFVKEFDPDCERTICAMTKIDKYNGSLLNFCTQKDVPQNVKYGYYLLKNRDIKEMETMTLQQGIQAETDFFLNDSNYKNATFEEKQNLGITNLRKKVGDILIEAIRNNIPELKLNLDIQEKKYFQELEDLGSSIPDTPQEKVSKLHIISTEIADKFKKLLKDNEDLNNSAGAKINIIFDKYRKDITNIDPFTTDKYEDEYIENIIRNSDGLDMPSIAPSMKVVSFCLRDPSKSVIGTLLKPSEECAKLVKQQIKEVMITILSNTCYKRFPKFVSKVQSHFDSNLLERYYELCISRIKEDIKSEESLTYTNDENFHIEYQSIIDPNKKNSKGNIVRSLLKNYYDTIVKTLQKTVPNKIVFHLFDNLINNITTSLITEIPKLENENLLEESSEIEYRRKYLTSVLSKIIEVKDKINKL
jgi:GTPase Era involved in 16S rRNA processing